MSTSLNIKARNWFEKIVPQTELLKYKNKNYFEKIVTQKELLKNKNYINERYLEKFSGKKITRRELIFTKDSHFFSCKKASSHQNEHLDKTKIIHCFKDQFKKDLLIKSSKKSDNLWKSTIQKIKKEKKEKDLEDFLKPSAEEIKWNNCIKIVLPCIFFCSFVLCLILIISIIILSIYVYC